MYLFSIFVKNHDCLVACLNEIPVIVASFLTYVTNHCLIVELLTQAFTSIRFQSTISQFSTEGRIVAASSYKTALLRKIMSTFQQILWEQATEKTLSVNMLSLLCWTGLRHGPLSLPIFYNCISESVPCGHMGSIWSQWTNRVMLNGLSLDSLVGVYCNKSSDKHASIHYCSHFKHFFLLFVKSGKFKTHFFHWTSAQFWNSRFIWSECGLSDVQMGILTSSARHVSADLTPWDNDEC